MSTVRKSGFRRDLHGLRAIAVLLVLLFHAGLPGLKGGFVGVDIFFVLSGFLITGNLLEEAVARSTISIRDFYAKRIRRLLPASLLVLLATLISSYYLLPPVLLPGIVGDITAAVLYVSNISFAHQATDYFAANATPSPDLQFWSLGVEEQFYIFWPLIVLLLTKTRWRIGVAIRCLAIVALGGSLAYAIWLLPQSQSWAFFSLPTRAWELALGAVLATFANQFRKLNYVATWILGTLGLGMVVASGLAIRSASQFPGLPALFPTVGAALIILAGAHHRNTFSTNFLSLTPMQYVGKISYSLYLWHWPLFVLPMIAVGHVLSWPIKSALLFFTFIASALTEKFIEKPVKAGLFTKLVPLRTFVIALSAMLLVIASSFGLRYQVLQSATKTNAAGVQSPTTSTPSTTTLVRTPTIDFPVPANLTPSLFTAKQDKSINYADHCHTQLNGLASKAPCLYGDTQSQTTVALFGDSHALAWFPALDKQSKREHWQLFSQTMSSCNPADIGAWSSTLGKIMENCPIWRRNAIQKIIAKKPLFVLVGGTRNFQTLEPNGAVASLKRSYIIWESGMRRTIDTFKQAGIKVILISDVPFAKGDPVICLSAHPNSAIACANPVSNAIDTNWLTAERAVAKAEAITLIEPQLWVCPTDPCPAIINNILVYFDPRHMTATFSQSLSGRLGTEIKKTLG